MINAIQNGILPNNQVNQGSNNIKKNSYNFMLKINGASLIEAPSVSLAPESGAARSLQWDSQQQIYDPMVATVQAQIDSGLLDLCFWALLLPHC
jgi:hypothetical protein